MSGKFSNSRDKAMGVAAAAAMLGAFMASGTPAAAHASMSPGEITAAVRSYQIPEGSVAKALNRFADVNGLRLIYKARLTQNLATRGLSGRYSLNEALDKLLSGTGLTYRLSGNGRTVSILLAQAATGTQSDAGTIALPTVEVEAPQGGTGCGLYGAAPCSGYGGAGLAQDPYNTSYVLPDASVGTKTDTPVMETPLNVQSVSQQVLQDQQVTTLEQALQNVSGVTVSTQVNNGHPYASVVLRGFTTDNYYRDGFRVDGGSAFPLSSTQFANVASVEVLKGPAAILYGLSEPGGIVNIITKEPLNAPYFAASQQIGSLRDYRTTLDATGPLTDDKAWLYRMSISYENNGAPFGSIIDLVHGQNILLAPVLKWNIDGATWVKLEAEYQHIVQGAYFQIDPVFNGQFVPIPRRTNYSEQQQETLNKLFAALTWSHQFDNDWSIKQQISYLRGTDSFPENGASPFIVRDPLPVFLRGVALEFNTQTTYATNVDLTGHFDTFGARHTLLLGGDFYKLDTYSISQFPSGLSSQIDVFNPVHPGQPIPPNILGTPNGLLTPQVPGGENFAPQDTAGLYAQDQIKLPNNFFVLAGARFQYIRQDGGLSSGTSFAAGPTKVLDAQTLQALTPRFGLLWRPEQWVSFYTTYTEGFAANGGFIFPNTPVPPTSAHEAEAGVKIELFDGKLRATADYYDLTKTNIPVVDLNPLHQCLGGGPRSCDLVTGAARSKGPEVDIQGEILPGWSAIVAYTNQDVIVTKGGTQFVQQPGQRFEGIPRNLGSVWTTYEFQPDTPLKGLKIGGGVLYHGSQPVSATSLTGQNLAGQVPLLSAYATVNLIAGYSFKIGETKMNAQVNVSNLLDHTYYTNAAYGTAIQTPGLKSGERDYGAPFSVIGSLSAQWPGDPSSPLSVPPPVPVFTWTGVYLGGQIGYAWGDNAGNVAYATPGGLFGTGPLEDVAQGLIGGAHVGYNLQINQWVIGLEGTVDATNLYKKAGVGFLDPTGAIDANFDPFGGTVGGFVKSDIQGSIRARAGFAWDRLLIYGTGGVAFGAFTTDLNIQAEDTVPGTLMPNPFPPPAFIGVGEFFYANSKRSTTRVGWTAGGGVEYAINNNWSVRGEYRYSDFGSITDSPNSGTAGLAFSANRHLAQNQVEAGFSYKFDSFAPASDTGADPVGAAAFGTAQVGPSQAGSSQVGAAQIGAAQVGAPQVGTAQVGAAPSLAAGLPSLPPVGPVDWTGIDLGFQAGFAWSNGNFSFTGFDSSAGRPASNGFIDTHNGAIGGAHLGYNYQIGQWVAGVEGSVDVTSSLSIASFPTAFGGSSLTASTASNVQGSIRARLGYAFDRALIYATGGVAFGEYPTRYNLIGNYSGNGGINGGNLISGSNYFTNFPVGWTAGGGIEYALNDHWSVRGEYRYTSFGTVSNPFIDGGALASTPGLSGSSLNASRRLNQNQVEAGFSYKFDAFAPPPVAAPALAAAAPAAGLPPPPPVPAITWTGFYLGGQIGYAWGDNYGNVSYATPGGLSGVLPLVDVPQGVIGGAHVGYNYQINQWVIGLEGTVDGTNLSRRVSIGISGGGATDAAGNLLGGTLAGIVRSNIQGSLRARGGFAWDRLLIYGTGGVAFGGFSSQLTISGEDASGFFYDDSQFHSRTRVGWTAGGGVEYAINNNWSVRGECRYSEFGHIIDSPAFPVAGLSYTGNRHLVQNQVQFGFNYKFDSFAPPPVVAKY